MPRKQRSHCIQKPLKYSGHYPRGNARNEIKINVLDLYHYGIEGEHDFRELTLKQTLRGEHQYIDTYLADMNDVINTRKLGISGVIDIYHRRKEYPVDTPYNKRTFNGNTSCFRDGAYFIDDYHGEVEDKLSFKLFRQDMLVDICNGPAIHGSKRIYQLQNWLSDKSIAFPVGNMAQKRYGELELLPGYYIRCSHCKSLTYLPLSTLMSPNVTRTQLTNFLRDFRDQGMEYMPDPEIYGECAMMVPMCFTACNSHCFNCNNDLFTDTIGIYNTIYTQSVAYINTIRGTHIEELTKMNMLQGAPPDNMPLAKAQFNALHNRHAAKTIAKMNALHINTMYQLNSGVRLDMLHVRNHLRLAPTGRISFNDMSAFESEEIILIADLSSATYGTILVNPTTPIVAASLHDICSLVCDTPYFIETEIVIDIPAVSDFTVHVFPAQYDIDKTVQLLLDGAYLLLPRHDVIQNFIYEDEEFYYTKPSDGEILVKWCKLTYHTFAGASKVYISNQYYNVYTITSGNHLQIVSIAIADDNYHARTLENHTTMQVLLPEYDHKSPLSIFGVFGNKWSYKTVNVELVRRLVTFALTGDKSINVIEAYYAGILSTHYTIGGKTVDLTNMPINEGLPELLFTLIILTNQNLVTAWAAYMHLNNFSTTSAITQLTQFLVSRVLRVTSQVVGKTSTWLTQVFEDPMRFVKRLTNSQQRLDSHNIFNNLLPLVIIDELHELGKPIVTTPLKTECNICKHHTADCSHARGDYRCICCGIVSSRNVCSCCARHTKCKHSCAHQCNNELHLCSACLDNKPCMIKIKCTCCGIVGCDPCPICPQRLDFNVQPSKPQLKTKILHGVTKKILNIPTMTKNNKEVIRSQPIGRDALVNLPHDQAYFKVGEKKYNMPLSLLNIDSPQRLFVVDDEKLYIPMLTFTGRYHVDIELTTPVVSNPIKQNDYCAYYCVIEQSDHSLNALINTYGDRPSVNANEIRKLIEVLSMNCLLIVREGAAEILRYGDQALPYILIIHSSLTDLNVPEHWCVPHIPKFTSYPTGYYSNRNLGRPFCDLENFNMWEVSSSEYANMKHKVDVMRKRMMRPDETIITIPRVVTVGNLSYLSNGNVHNPRLGLIHCAIPLHVEQSLMDALNGGESLEIDVSYANLTNSWSNVEQDIEAHITLKILEINKLLRIISHQALPLNKLYSFKVNNENEYLYGDMLGKLKPLDIVIIKKEQVMKVEVVQGSAKEPCIYNALGKDSEVFVLRQSMSSLYRSLILGFKAHKNLNNLRTITFGNVIDGIAGCGKTTQIVQLPKLSLTTLICKTRSALNLHMNSGFHSVLSIEAVGLTEVLTKTIVVDEASMLTNVELAAAIDEPHMLVHLYGDDFQIGVKDMSDITGKRQENSLLKQFPTKIDRHTYRFGEPLVSTMLKQFVPDITCEQDRVTEITHERCNTYEEIASLVSKYKPDAIYAFMTDDYNQLMANHQDDCQVHKVHSSQGLEFDVVLVVHWGNFTVANSIVKSSKFIFTAATRAKKHLIWVTPSNLEIDISNIADMTYIGSGINSEFFLCPEDLCLTRSMTDVEMHTLATLWEQHPDFDKKLSQLIVHTSSIRFTTQHTMFFQTLHIDFTIDRTGWHANNATTLTFQKKIKDMLRPVIAEHVREMTTKSTNEILNYSGSNLVESNEVIYDSTSDDEMDSKPKSRSVFRAGSQDSRPEHITTDFIDSIKLQTNTLGQEGNIDSHNYKDPSSLSTLPNVIDKIDRTLFSNNIVNGTINSLHLSASLWSKLIVLADICTSAQATNTPVIFNLLIQEFKVSIFNGCSVYCGFKFRFANSIVLISSAHDAGNRDSLLSTLNAGNRHIVGRHEDVYSILEWLQSDTHLSCVSPNLIYSRYMERLKSIFQSVTTDCSFSEVGTKFGPKNIALAKQCYNYSSNWQVPTHQLVTQYVTTHGTGYMLQPSMHQVNSAVELFKYFSGIAGNDVPFDLDRKNTHKLENVLVHHMNAEEKFDRPIYIPSQLLNNSQLSRFFSVIQQDNIQSVPVGCTLTSACHIAMLLAGIILKQQHNIQQLHYVGLSAQLFCMNYNYGDTIEQVPPNQLPYITTMLKSKVSALINKIDTNTHSNLSTDDLIKFYSDINNVVNSGRSKVTILHPKFSKLRSRRDTYLLTPETYEPTCYLHGDTFIESDMAATPFTVNHENCPILYMIGPFAIRKNTSKTFDVKLNVNTILHRNVRIFSSNIDRMKLVKIPEPIFKRLFARAMAEKDCTLSTMIAYSRSILHTMTYTSKGYSFKYNDDPLELLSFCVVVLNYTNRQKKLTSAISSLLQSTDSSTSTNLMELLTGAIKVMFVNLFQTNMQPILESINNSINNAIQSNNVTNTLFSLFKDVSFTELIQQDSLVLTTNRNSEAQSNNDQSKPPNVITTLMPNPHADESTLKLIDVDIPENSKPNSSNEKSNKGKQIVRYVSDSLPQSNVMDIPIENINRTHGALPQTESTVPSEISTPVVKSNIPDIGSSKHALKKAANAQLVKQTNTQQTLTLEQAFNQIINDGYDTTVATDVEIGDVLLLYTGSRGDAQPLHAIAEVAIAANLQVSALVPRDIHYKIPGVKYIPYCESYDFITNNATNSRLPPFPHSFEFAKCVFGTWLNESSKHRIVISLFFSTESVMIQGTELNIRIIPQLDPVWDTGKKMKWLADNSLVRKVFTKNQVPIVGYWAAPFALLDRDDNLGFLIPESSLVMDAYTILALRFCKQHMGNVSVVTLGSMVPDDHAVKIQNMLNAATTPVLLVTNKLHQFHDKITYGQVKLSLHDVGIYHNICILPSVNYFCLKGSIHTAMHHCGAGTYATFRLLGVKQIPYPQAFDQNYNAWLCTHSDQNSQYDKTHTITDQINESRRRIMNMLKIKGPVKTIEIVIPDGSENELPTIEPNINKSVVINRGSYTNIKHFTNTYTTDCVLLTLFEELNNRPDLHISIETAYCNTSLHTLEDVIAFILQLPINCNIHHKNDGYMILKEGADAIANLSITDDCTHANAFKFDAFAPITTPSGGNIRDVVITEDFNEDIKQIMTILQYHHNINSGTIHDNLVLTTLRKYNACHIVKGTPYNRGIEVADRLTIGYTYACIGEQGVFLALACNGTNDTTHLVHMQDDKLNTNVCIRLNKKFEPKFEIHRSIVKRVVNVAMNHTTNTILAKRGIICSSIGMLHADNLYIYSSWVREHHLEKELDCIKTAKKILLVPPEETKPPKDIRSLRHVLLESRIPVCILKGKLYFRLEQNDIHTHDILRCIPKIFNLTDKLSVYPWSNDMTLDMEQSFYREGELIKYVNTADIELPTNLQELLTLCKCDTMSIIIRLKNMMTRHGYITLETCPIERVKVEIELPLLSLICRQKIHITEQNIYINVNAWVFEISKQGKGFVEVDNLEIPVMTDNKFNNNRFVQGLYTEQVTPLVRDMTSLLPLDMPTYSSEFIMSNSIDYHAKENQLIIVANVGTYDIPVDSIKFDEVPNAIVQDFWNNTELLDSNIILPTNPNFRVNSRIQPIRIKENAYLLMEEYPQYARPSRSKAFAEELNSITNRHGAYTVYRTMDLNIADEVQLLLHNYMKPNYNRIIHEYQRNPITFSCEATQAWIDKHNVPTKVITDLKEMMLTGWEKTPINLMNVHGKTEQTTKLKSSRWFNEIITRSIVAAPYAVSALFADIFLEAKQRLKALLSNKIFYSDGSTPMELAAVIRTNPDFTYCVEDDLTQQDRQVDHQLIRVEMELYKLLGVSDNVLQFYRKCHEQWPWKGHGISGVWDAMRLSGQVTTALGNAVTNLIVHNRFMLRNNKNITKMLFLGDDIIFLMKQQVNVSKHGTETRELYNMQSKIVSRKYVGGFISMIVYNIDGNIGICPHFKRMRHRFSVCNYTYPVDDTSQKITNRVLSYLFMMGQQSWTTTLVEQMGFNVKLPQWYHMDTAIMANALYDSTDEFTIRSHIGALKYMLENQIVVRHKFKTWSSM